MYWDAFWIGVFATIGGMTAMGTLKVLAKRWLRSRGVPIEDHSTEVIELMRERNRIAESTVYLMESIAESLRNQ